MTYSSYSDRVQSYMKKLEKTLKAEQKEISLATEVNLDLLASNLEIYFQLYDDIKANGVLRIGKEKQSVKSPALQPLNAQNATIMKLINSLGLSPMSKSKMKNINISDDEDFEESLVS